MKPEIFLQGLAMICSCFKVEVDEKTVKIYEMLMHDLGDSEFMEAVINLCRSTNRLPGENLAAVIRNQVEKQDGLSGEEAWAEVKKAISTHGSWGQPSFSRPAVKSAVEALGWKTICATEDSQIGVLRAHFFRIYDSYLKRNGIQETREQLVSAGTSRLLSGIGQKMIAKPAKQFEAERKAKER